MKTWKNNGRRRYGLPANLAILAVTLLLVVLVDRGLLALLGRPIWEWDPVLHYRHRAGAESSWDYLTRVRMVSDDVIGRDVEMRLLAGREYDVTENRARSFIASGSAVAADGPAVDRRIRINRYGHHDDEFPIRKQGRELRGVVIGNSVVMGHGVTAAETFVNRLEEELARAVPGYDGYQVINTGVQGYATFQYREMLRRSLRFDPDFVLVGFCMNDVTEPYVVNRAFGGTGFDYHGVEQAPSRWSAYLVNETGFGRLGLEFRAKIARRDKAERLEVFNVSSMVEGMKRDSTYIKAWDGVLSDLAGIYGIAEDEGLPVILVIFPYTFQIGNAESRSPQRLLKRHAAEHGVTYLDLTETVETALEEGAHLSDLFLDQNHFTAQGHRLVAESLLEHLVDRGLVTPYSAGAADPNTAIP